MCYVLVTSNWQCLKGVKEIPCNEYQSPMPFTRSKVQFEVKPTFSKGSKFHCCSFEELLSRQDDVTIHVKKPTETAIRSLKNPPLLKSVIPLGGFQIKSITYNLRKNVFADFLTGLMP